MTPLMTPVASAALAAISVYFLDPDRGRRRRALLRDRMTSTFASAFKAADVGGRDLVHRARGAAARARRRWSSDDPDDDVLRERVRAAMGHVTSHPGAIDVTAQDGRVKLGGDVLRHEHETLIECVAAVRGVRNVEDELYVHETADHVSSLQGGQPRLSSTSASRNWSPAACLVASVGGGLLMAMGARRRTPSGLAVAGVGSALLMRGLQMHLQARKRTTERRVIDIRKSVHIEAPVEQVFETLARHEDFPRFMRHVRSVTPLADGRSRWVVDGPAGTTVEFDSETTACIPNEVLAWCSTRNAKVGHSGIMRLHPEGSGTRLHIDMSYHPPAGAFGHLVAKMFGADAKTELDDDLLRLKTFLETGVPPRDAARRSRAIELACGDAPKGVRPGL